MMLKYQGGLPRGRRNERIVVRVKRGELRCRSSYWSLITFHHWSLAIPLASVGTSQMIDTPRGIGRFLTLGLWMLFTHPQSLAIPCQLGGVATTLVLGGSKVQLRKLDQQLLTQRLRLAAG